VIEVHARPRQADLILARAGVFIQGRELWAWIGMSVALAAAWGIARAVHHAIAARIVLPVFLVVVALPLIVVLAGVQSKTARAALAGGLRYRFDDDGVSIEGELHRWADVDDAFEIGAVVVVVVGRSVHAIPRKAFETKSRFLELRGLLRLYAKQRAR
jgi:hypothetical protein